jgi:hypothetical protein
MASDPDLDRQTNSCPTSTPPPVGVVTLPRFPDGSELERGHF